ncbi:MAG: hypothetical protein KGN76_11775 [Acidobacteriota bacterium]|nr:hypothetical protein [Acidobacteriota bacterium]
MQTSRSASFRLVAAVAILVSLAAWPAAAQQDRKETVPGIYNYTQVDASVACGGATDPSAIAELKKRGFVSIVNFRLAVERGSDVAGEEAAAKKVGIKYFHLPLNPADPLPSVADAFLKVVTDKANQPVYIHCATASRVGAMWLIKRVLVDGWTIDRATKEAELIGLRGEGLKTFALDYIKSHEKAHQR